LLSRDKNQLSQYEKELNFEPESDGESKTLKAQPLVSIITPVFNGEKYLREAVDSALSQTYQNTEIIIVNDGSTDSTEEIILAYGNKVKYFKKKNGGVSTALNLAIRKSKGEYISWLSHDDVYLPKKIEDQIAEISQLVDKNTILYGNWDYINAFSL
jgi:glycosyltransferase involved in cell wall biosynthesis